MSRPNTADYPEYFGRYINLVSEDDLKQAFENQSAILHQFLDSVDEEKSMYAYASGKWSLKEMLQHIIDTERVFVYRALCVSRKETVSLPSFDENLYASNANANARTWQSMKEEFINARTSTQDLFNSFTQEMLQQKGTASNKPINVASLGFIIVGHLYHHINVAKERYF